METLLLHLRVIELYLCSHVRVSVTARYIEEETEYFIGIIREKIIIN